MFVHYRTQGFILKKEDRGEADHVLTIFTKDFGKLEILAKAVRKIKSKLRSGAQLFCLSEIEFIQGKGHKTLTDAVLIEKFAGIRNNFKKLKIAYKIAEVFNELIRGEEPDEKIWILLNNTFEKLDGQKLEIRTLPAARTLKALPILEIRTLPAARTLILASLEIRTLPAARTLKALPILENWKLKIIYYFFLWNLFSLLGYSPEVYNCSLCRKKLTPQKLFFSPKEGGIICEQCRNLVKSVEEIDIDTIKILRILLKNDWQTIFKLKIEKSHLRKLKEISENYCLRLLGDLTIIKNP